VQLKQVNKDSTVRESIYAAVFPATMRNRNDESEISDDESSESCFSVADSLQVPTEHGAYLPPEQVTFGGSTCETESTISSLGTLTFAGDSITQGDKLSDFCVGDHVFTWCSLLALPRAYQHHGIVVEISDKSVKIIDFYPLFEYDDHDESNCKSRSSSSAIGSDTKGRPFTMSEVVLDHVTAQKEWKRVQYNVPWKDRLLRRSGTYSTAVPDAVGFVLSRIDFLQENGHILPRYDQLLSNCECVAVWCKTGCFCSLQGSALLGGVAKGSLRATALVGIGAATATTTVPCAGVWGWIGFTTTVPLTTAVPFLMPLIIAGGVASTLPPIVILQRCKKEWSDVTKALNICLAEGCREGLYLPHAPRFPSL